MLFVCCQLGHFFCVIFWASQFNSYTISYSESKSLNEMVQFTWPLEKFTESDLNLPEISCSGSPLLCLCVKLFGFVLFVNILLSLMLVLNWDTLASQKSFSFVIVWNINALSITHVERRFNRLCLVNSCHGSMVPK